MSPALLANTGVGAGQRNTNGSVTLSPQERDEQLQRAFQQGVEHAERRLGEQDLSREASALQGQLASQEAQNEEQQRALAQRIEELQRREYRAPIKPMGCQEERAAMLACYRKAEGLPPGEAVALCQRACDELDKCATIVREAAMAKVVAGSLSSES